MAKTTFVNGDPSQQIPGTVVTAEFLSAVNNHRHRGLDQDGDGALDYAEDTGAANAYAFALTPALTAYVVGMPMWFKAANANDGASTCNVNELGAKTMKVRGAALVAGNILAGQMICVIYDGVDLQVVSSLEAPIAAVVPAGTVLWFAANAAPSGGYLKANGAAISRTTYAALFAAIGTTFGVGDGATTFNIPDLRGEFVRGWDDSRGIDTGRTFGSAQAEAFGSHNHYNGIADNETVDFVYGATTNGMPGSATYSMQTETTARTYQGLTSTNGTETRPRNIALLACIKY